FLEYLHFAEDASRILVLLNGEELATLSVAPPPLRGWQRWFRSWLDRALTDVFVEGRHWGRVIVERPYRNFELHLDRGGVLELPFLWGHTGLDVLKIFARILFLTPLWSSSMP